MHKKCKYRELYSVFLFYNHAYDYKQKTITQKIIFTVPGLIRINFLFPIWSLDELDYLRNDR